jgi:SAM-dependent methyltransferase
MQVYGQIFANVYNKRWTGFARQVAPLILDFYSATTNGKTNEPVLDLGCGTGQLALHFLENGYQVVGIDGSEYMLKYANENAKKFVDKNKVKFIQGNVADFHLDERFGLVVSTFDTLNHLSDEEELSNCFKCAASLGDGYFIFDLNTRAGLNRWNNIHVDDSEEMLIITRGIYDGQSDKAWTRISGFLKREDGLFERFDETAYNTVFDLIKVKELLHQAGWPNAYFARVQDLETSVEEPEKEGRIFIVASK